MPHATIGGIRLYYAEDGAVDAPPLILTHSLGTNADLWAPQVPLLSRFFRVIRYDTRGHGLSSLPSGEYSFDALADDLLGLMDHLGIAKAHLCGTSMGGMTVLQAALKRPERVQSLILCNTAARIGSVESWTARIAMVNEQGLDKLAPTLVTRWVADDFRVHEAGRTQSLCDMLRRTPDAGYTGNCAALRDGDLRDRLGGVKAPALVISGDSDLAATGEQALHLTKNLADARHVELHAAHTSNWERPDEFTAAVLNFLN